MSCRLTTSIHSATAFEASARCGAAVVGGTTVSTAGLTAAAAAACRGTESQGWDDIIGGVTP